MKRIIVFCIVLLATHCYSQKLATIFIDSIRIILNLDTVYYSDKARVYFLKTTQNNLLPVYDKDSVKIFVNFAYANPGSRTSADKGVKVDTSKQTYILLYNGLQLYIKDKFISYKYLYASSGLTNKFRETLLNIGTRVLNTEKEQPVKINQIDIFYRLLKMAPVDTSNYTGNLKNGIWIKEGSDHSKIFFTYKNGLKNGPGWVILKDGSKFETEFKDGKALYFGDWTIINKMRLVKRYALYCDDWN